MYQIQSPLMFFLIIFYTLIFSSFSEDHHIDDIRYTKCAPINATFCGSSSQKISYPFWENTRLPNYCGHPGFKLECQNNNSLTIQIANQTYNVLKIDYVDHALTISKAQFSKGPCPSTLMELTNSTIDLNLFNFTSKSQNATLFYDCPSSNFDVNAPYSFTCKSNNSYLAPPISTSPIFNNSLGFFAISEDWKDELRKYCGVEIDIQVLSSSILRIIDNKSNSSNITDILNKGFELKWLIDDKQCNECLNSGGRCGYNQSLSQPVCFCKDGSYSTSCGDSHAPLNEHSSSSEWKLSKKKNFIIGVCASSTFILLCILIFLYRRYRKKHPSSPLYASEGKFSAGSSTTSNLPSINRSTYFGVQVFNYKELERATDSFNPLKELGDGGFGTVYHGKLRDGREVAIKRLYENNQRRVDQFMNEVEILAHLRHKNLVTLYGCTPRQSHELLLVYEYVPNGTVADHLHGKQAKLGLLAWPKRLSIAIETASALVYLHATDIIHRDVKTQNILLDKDFSVKVADFGLSRLFPLDVTHVSTAPQGTPGYVDPEYHQCYHLTGKSDVYSFGVVLAELISSKPAVDITRPRQEINLSNMLINKIQNQAMHEFVDPSLGFESDCEVNKEISAVAELAFRCLQSTRDARPSMEEVLETLYNIKGQPIKDKADVVDIPAADVVMLKGELSPTSPPR